MTDARELGKEIASKVAAEEEETVEEPVEPVEGEDDDAEAEEAEEQPDEPEQKGRKTKTPEAKFEGAMTRFRDALAAFCEVIPAEITQAPYPGVVGFMLPGFAAPKTHENYRACVTCNGRGEVLTGAQTGKHEFDFHVCPDNRCKGRGYWEKNAAQPQAPATGPLAVQPVQTGDGEFGEAPSWMGDPSLSPAA